MLLASKHLTNGKPTILALGVTHSGGGFTCEITYVSPTPGVTEKHAPLPAGIIPIQFWPDAESNPITTSINWPGLTTNVPAGQRMHENLFFKEETREQTEEEGH